MMKLLLEWEKYGFDTVLTADNVEDAINILQDERPELLIVDVVIEDVFGMDAKTPVFTAQAYSPWGTFS